MANNNAILNAVIAGCTGGNQERWITTDNGSSYAAFNTQVLAIATTVDALIPAGSITIAQARLMQSICQGVFAGRFPQASQYMAIANAIVTLYNVAKLNLEAEGGGGSSITPLTADLYVDAGSVAATPDGSIAAPFPTVTAGITALGTGTLHIVPGEYSAEILNVEEGSINFFADTGGEFYSTGSMLANASVLLGTLNWDSEDRVFFDGISLQSLIITNEAAVSARKSGIQSIAGNASSAVLANCFLSGAEVQNSIELDETTIGTVIAPSIAANNSVITQANISDDSTFQNCQLQTINVVGFVDSIIFIGCTWEDGAINFTEVEGDGTVFMDPASLQSFINSGGTLNNAQVQPLFEYLPRSNQFFVSSNPTTADIRTGTSQFPYNNIQQAVNDVAAIDPDENDADCKIICEGQLTGATIPDIPGANLAIEGNINSGDALGTNLGSLTIETQSEEATTIELRNLTCAGVNLGANPFSFRTFNAQLNAVSESDFSGVATFIESQIFRDGSELFNASQVIVNGGTCFNMQCSNSVFFNNCFVGEEGAMSVREIRLGPSKFNGVTFQQNIDIINTETADGTLTFIGTTFNTNVDIEFTGTNGVANFDAFSYSSFLENGGTITNGTAVTMNGQKSATYVILLPVIAAKFFAEVDVTTTAEFPDLEATDIIVTESLTSVYPGTGAPVTLWANFVDANTIRFGVFNTSNAATSGVDSLTVKTLVTKRALTE